MRKDIESIKDVQLLVNRFYALVREDELLGPVFNSSLEGRWEMHHRKLYRFWNTVLFRRPDYYGHPVPIHFKLRLNGDHFDRWLELWRKTVDENFEGPVADRAKYRGKTMAESFLLRIRKASEH